MFLQRCSAVLHIIRRSTPLKKNRDIHGMNVPVKGGMFQRLFDRDLEVPGL